MKEKMDIPRLISIGLFLVGFLCVVCLLFGYLSEEYVSEVSKVAITCFSFATGGKFLNQISDFRGDR